MFVAIARRRFLKPPVTSPPLFRLFFPFLHSLSTNRAPPLPTVTLHRDLSVDPAVARSNFLITRFSREGKISDARQLFDETPNRDLITWTALISGYIRCGQLREARLLFDRPDAKRNVITWTAMLSGYVRFYRIREAEKLFDRIPDKNVVSYNTMLSGYANNGLMDKARHLFDEMPVRNVVSWNTMLTGLSRVGLVDEAYGLFCRMDERDVISWTAMVAGLGQNGKIDRAREVFERMPERNVVSWNAMVSGYAQNQRVEEALELFEKMPVRDTPSWNTMITGLIQNGKLKRARELFDEMKERNVVTWTTLIEGYVKDNQNESAVKSFMAMLMDGIKPNEGTFVSVLGAISILAALQEGQQVHQIISKTPFQLNPFVESALINMYSKCGEIGLTRKVFELSNSTDLVSWNSMIAAFAHHGLGREAVRVFEEMQKNGLKPNDVTYVGLLSACSHSGLVDEGLKFFRSMVKDESVEVREDHYACLVDLCGRAGRVQEAKNLIEGLRIKDASPSVWGALLGGCNNHGNFEIGELAARKLLEAEPDNAGTYTLLSNIYASEGRWEEAKKIRLKMKNRGLKKQPGCSWIDVGNRVHVFVVRDKLHSERELIYNAVDDLHDNMKMIDRVYAFC